MSIVARECNFDNVLKKECIGRPKTPGCWKTPILETVPVTDLLLTCGGGIGGTSWHLYIKRIPLHDICMSNGMMEVETWDGYKYVINSRYLVSARQMGIAIGIYHSDNDNFKVGDWEYAYLVEDGHVVHTSNR